MGPSDSQRRVQLSEECSIGVDVPSAEARLFLEEHVLGVLVPCMQELQRAIHAKQTENATPALPKTPPLNPIDWLASLLMRNNPRHNPDAARHPYFQALQKHVRTEKQKVQAEQRKQKQEEEEEAQQSQPQTPTIIPQQPQQPEQQPEPTPEPMPAPQQAPEQEQGEGNDLDAEVEADDGVEVGGEELVGSLEEPDAAHGAAETEETVAEEGAEGDAEGEDPEQRAATSVQKTFRGHLSRKRVKRIKEEAGIPTNAEPQQNDNTSNEAAEQALPSAEELDNAEHHGAATAVQRTFRGHKERKQVAEIKRVKKEAATAVQKTFRGHKERKQVAEIKKQSNEAATAVQKTFRGHKERKQVAELKKQSNDAATAVQKTFRGHKDRKRVAELKQSKPEIGEDTGEATGEAEGEGMEEHPEEAASEEQILEEEQPEAPQEQEGEQAPEAPDQGATELLPPPDAQPEAEVADAAEDEQEAPTTAAEPAAEEKESAEAAAEDVGQESSPTAGEGVDLDADVATSPTAPTDDASPTAPTEDASPTAPTEATEEITEEQEEEGNPEDASPTATDAQQSPTYSSGALGEEAERAIEGMIGDIQTIIANPPPEEEGPTAIFQSVASVVQSLLGPEFSVYISVLRAESEAGDMTAQIVAHAADGESAGTLVGKELHSETTGGLVFAMMNDEESPFFYIPDVREEAAVGQYVEGVEKPAASLLLAAIGVPAVAVIGVEGPVGDASEVHIAVATLAAQHAQPLFGL